MTPRRYNPVLQFIPVRYVLVWVVGLFVLLHWIGPTIGLDQRIVFPDSSALSVDFGVPLILLMLMCIYDGAIVLDRIYRCPVEMVRADVIDATDPAEVDAAIVGQLDRAGDESPSAEKARQLIRSQRASEEVGS